MNGIWKSVFAAAAAFVLLPAVSVFAVTDEEIAKIRAAMPDKPVVAPQQPRTLLVFNLSEGFNHSCIPYWAKALDIMAEKTGAFAVEHSMDKAVFAPETLSRFDAVCFNNTTDLKLNDAQKEALMAFIKGGKGIVGIHAATDNFNDWPEGRHMMGGVFQGHPWEANGTWAIKLDEPDHPLLAPFGGEGFKVNDEIYRTNLPYYSRDRQRVLMSLDMSDPATRSARGVVPEDMDTGISWIKPYGKGRLFYCSLGHNHHLTWTSSVLGHFLAGIQYALGDLEVDDTPLGATIDAAAVKAMIEKVKEYDWGRSRASLTEFEAVITQAYGSPESLKQIELLMQPLLRPGVNAAARDFACRQLSVFATAASVPALAALLDEPETEHMARYVLERIPDAAADAALLEKLGRAKHTDTKIGIITSLGQRRSSEAVGVIGRMAAVEEKTVAQAAVQALGSIGTTEAATVLRDLQPSLASDMQARVLDALVLCADRFAGEGKAAEATAIYELLYKDGNPALIRLAALTGIARTNPYQFNSLLPKAIVSGDRMFQSGAIRLVASVRDTAALQSIVASADKLSADGRVQLLTALAEGGSPVGLRAALDAMADENAAVRIAAYQTLGVVGDVRCVMPLAEAAAGAGDRAERDAARQALYRLKGQGVTVAIEREITRTLGPARSEGAAMELIRAVGERGIVSANALLFAAARDTNTRVASEALRALQTTLGGDDVPLMATLLAENPSAATENLTVAAAEKIAEQNRRAAALLAQFDTLQSTEAKASYLRVMGRLGDVNAAATIRRMRVSDDKAVSDAAFRAMTDWPGPEFLEQMYQAAKDNPDETQKILAFRAYIRMLGVETGLSDDQRVDALAEAMTMTDRPQEQRLVLSAMGGYGTAKALQLAQAAMDNPDLRAEAEVAVVNICTRLAATDPDKAMAALEALRPEAANQRLVQQIRRLGRAIQNRAGFVVQWAIAGPYTEAGKSGHELFNTVFAPEENAAAVSWRPMPISPDPERSWLMDLLEAVGGTNRVAYARTAIRSPRAAEAVFEIGSDDGVKVWLNGTLVHAYEAGAGRAVVAGEDKVPVRLKEGDNAVLMKITQAGGDWGFCLRVTRPDGTPMTGLEVRPL